ncbi:hypothetical protein [Actinomadura kijaniata]|nr:hypothetical protein [Actinomadura kijaniata]
MTFAVLAAFAVVHFVAGLIWLYNREARALFAPEAVEERRSRRASYRRAA